MKKFFILASAAIVALASCAKTEVVYNDAPEEIAFKQITGVMTKATSPLTGSMDVYAYWGGNEYFGKTEFSVQDGETYWTSATPKYWPASGDVTFYMNAPHYANASYDASEGLVFNKAANEQIDLLYGTVTSAKTSSAVPVTLYHALAQIQVNVTGVETITLSKVELLNVNDAGKGTVTFGTETTVDWDLGTTPIKADFTIHNGDVTLSSTAKECSSKLVVPGTLTDEQIKLTYKVSGSNATLTYSTPTSALGTSWAHGKKYIYNISFGVEEIMFNATVENWSEENKAL